MSEKVVVLHGRLSQIWYDPLTTNKNRKALLRCLVEKVVLERTAPTNVQVRILWRGGAATVEDVPVAVATMASLPRGTEMRERIIELANAGNPDEAIAEILTTEGHRSPRCPDRVLPISVSCIRRRAGIKVARPRSRWQRDEGKVGVAEMAARMGISEKWLRVQIRNSRIMINDPGSGAILFDDEPTTYDAIRSLRSHLVERIDLRADQLNHTGYQHA